MSETEKEAALLPVRSNAGLASGKLAHHLWESVRGKDDECDEERRIKSVAFDAGIEIPMEWWNGWLERSDEWRDLIIETANDRVEGCDAALSRRVPWNDWFGVLWAQTFERTGT